MAQPVKVKQEILKFVGLDSFCRPTYLKQINFKEVIPNIPIVLHDTADNTFDGEPNNPHNIIMID